MRKLLLLTITLQFNIALASAGGISFDWTTVANAGNASDSNGLGSVGYEFRVSKHEVTNAQYADFLNTVAATDTNALFNANMDISRSGSSGSFAYTVASGLETHPVTWVSFFDAMRFTNWLENGQGMGDTETGVYTIGATGLTETRAPGAKYFIPSENEWYKAGFHDPRTAAAGGPTGDDNYWLYATQSDALPTAEAPAGGSNSANLFHAVGDTTPVGAYTNAPSYYGTLDQVGNVWEWNESLVDAMNRGVLGGGYTSDVVAAEATVRGTGGPDVEKFKIGFRVAALPEPDAPPTPEPSSLAYGFAVLGLLIRRRARSVATT